MEFGHLISISIIVVCLYILWQIRQLLLLLFAAVILADALNGLVKKLQKWKIKRGYAVLLAVGILLVIFGGFVWIIVPPFVDQFQELVQLVPQGIEQLIIWLKQQVNQLDPDLVQSLPNLKQITQELQPIFNEIAGRSLRVFYSTLGIPLSLLLLLALTLMLSVNPQPYRQGFVRLFPAFYRRRVEKILDLCDEALQGWLNGILFNVTVIAILSFIGLSILQIPLALSQAMLAGLLTFIPNIGPTLSVIPPMAIALLEEPWKAPAVLILYILLHQIESQLLTPLVMAHQVSLLPGIILLSQLFFATFFGVLGLILALPLTVVGGVWLQEVVVKDILEKWKDENIEERKESP